MKPSVPKSGLLSRLFIVISLAAMSACSQESAAPDPAPEDAPVMSDTPDETVQDDAGAGDQPDADDAASTSAPTGERASADTTDPAIMEPEKPLETMALTQGEWFMKDGEALFGPPESEATFSIGCQAEAGEVLMTRSIDIVEEKEVRLVLFTDTGRADSYWRDAGDVMPLAVATLPASSDIFDRIAAADRFAVGAEGDALLVLPVTESLRQMLAACT